jgi:glycosyltransferase involved in cell wall biosynthesis
MHPLVSIITTTYNREKVISQTIQSILNQTFKSWECIIIDDHSNDNTIYTINNYINNDPRFKLISNKSNVGVSESRNIGLSIAKGDYIFIIDSDDVIGTDKLSRQVSFLETNSEIDICYTGARYFYTDSNLKYLYGNDNFLIQVEVTKYDADLVRIFSIRNPFVVGALLYRKKVFEKVGFYDKSLRLYEDWDHNLRCAKANCIIHYLGYSPEIGTYIRIHKQSLIYNANITNKFYYKLLNKHHEVIKYSVLMNPSKNLLKLYIPPILFIYIKKIGCYLKGK